MKRLLSIALFCVLVPCAYADTYVVQFPDTSKEQFRSIKQALKENFVAERKGVSTAKRELRYVFNGDIDDFVDELEESLDEASFSVGDMDYDASIVIVEIEKFPDGQQETFVASNSSTSEILYRQPRSKFVEGSKKWFTDGDEAIHVKYVGETKDGVPHGTGTATVSFDPHKGQKYVGKWKDGKWHGQGTLTLANGDKYVGEYKDGKMNGQGTYTWANGNEYVGEYKDDKRNGQGTFTFATGEKYVGEFKDGKRHGQGTLTLANGDKYVGETKDGKWQSKDSITDSNSGPSTVLSIFKCNEIEGPTINFLDQASAVLNSPKSFLRFAGTVRNFDDCWVWFESSNNTYQCRMHKAVKIGGKTLAHTVYGFDPSNPGRGRCWQY